MSEIRRSLFIAAAGIAIYYTMLLFRYISLYFKETIKYNNNL